MKINKIKILFAIAISVLLGFLCEIIAPEADSRNWVALIVAAITIFSGLAAAIGFDYSNTNRGVSIKVFAWVFTIVIALSNFLFCLSSFKIDVYIVVNLLIAVLGWLVIYGIVKLPEK